MTRLSVLDLAPVPEGAPLSDAFRHSADLARHVEALGYHRVWLAEHHNMPGIASAATPILIAHVAAATKTIRVGSGGIMLPNHVPLVIAETFGSLEALHPGRIDLGLGRAPGTDMRTAQALRRATPSRVDSFPNDVLELQHYFDDPAPRQAVVAVPGAGQKIPLYILGSSLYGAELAGRLGLPFAFASHFAPDALVRALEVYRHHFKPSAQLETPYVIVGTNVIAAETDDEAHYLSTSLIQAFVRLRRGELGKLPPPVRDLDAHVSPMEKASMDHLLRYSAIGGRETIRRKLADLIELTQADELMVGGQVFDLEARLASYTILAEVMGLEARAS